MSCSDQKRKRGAIKTGMGLEDGAMEEDNGFGFEIGGLAEKMSPSGRRQRMTEERGEAFMG